MQDVGKAAPDGASWISRLVSFLREIVYFATNGVFPSCISSLLMVNSLASSLLVVETFSSREVKKKKLCKHMAAEIKQGLGIVSKCGD